MRNPWTKIPLEKPFILKEDFKFINSYNKRTKNKDYKIHTDLLPDPYIGNKNANIILLNKNPGIGGEEKKLHHNPLFKKALIRNLKHQTKDFYYFRKEFIKSSGYTWWKSKLGRLLEAAKLEDPGERLFVVELFPYHSKRFGALDSGRLPSNAYIKRLILSAIRGSKWIIIMRGRKEWKRFIPRLGKYRKIALIRNRQNPVISKGNLENNGQFKKLVTALKK